MTRSFIPVIENYSFYCLFFCSEHSEKITFNGIDEESGELVVIHEWIIYTRSNTEHASVQRQISSIEQEFNYLLKLNHCNLVRYLNIKHESTEDKFIVQILQEFVSGDIALVCNLLVV